MDATDAFERAHLAFRDRMWLMRPHIFERPTNSGRSELTISIALRSAHT